MLNVNTKPVYMGSLDEDELETLREAVRSAKQLDTDERVCVVVYSSHGYRTWHVSCSAFVLFYRGDKASFQGAFALSPDHAEYLATKQGEESVDLSVVGDILEFKGEYSSQSVGCTLVDKPRRPTRLKSPVSFTARGADVLRAVLPLPYTGKTDASFLEQDPRDLDVIISVEHGTVSVHPNWFVPTATISRSTVPAKTQGEGRIYTSSDICSVLSMSEIIRDESCTFEFDPHNPVKITVTSESLTIVVATTSLRNFVNSVSKSLGSVRDNSLLPDPHFGFNDSLDSIDMLCDGLFLRCTFTPEKNCEYRSLHISSRLLSNANKSTDLLYEINAYNAALNGTTLVFADKDKSLSVVTSLPRSAINPYALADAIRAVAEATKEMQGLYEPFAGESVYMSTYSALSDFQRSAQRFPPLTSDAQLEYVAMYQTLIMQIDALNKTGKAKSLAKAKELEKQANRILEHVCASCWKLSYLIVCELSEKRFGKERSYEMLPDLLAEANIAIVQAVHYFDKQQIPKFHTYAGNMVRNHIRAVLGKEGYLRLAPGWNRVKRMAATHGPELASKLGRQWSVDELRDLLEVECLKWSHDQQTDAQKLLPGPKRRKLAETKLRKQGMLSALLDLEDILLIAQPFVKPDAPLGVDASADAGDST